jgi:predicted MPP superfamily phosphohydrolase
VLIAVVVLVILLLIGGIHWYLWRRLVHDPLRRRSARRLGTISIIALGLLVPATLVGSRALPLRSQAWIAWPGYIWLALMFYLLVTLAALELPRLALRRWARRPAAEAPPVDQSRRLLLARSTALIAGTATISATGLGMRTALGPPGVRRVPIHLAKLPSSMTGFRIALVADIHLGPLLGRAHTERIVRIINSLDADLVAVVGDLVDGSVAELGPAAAPLADLKARHGSYFVTGNHEYFSGYAEWVDEVNSLGLTVLRNSRVDIDGLDLAGVNDLSGGSYGDGPDMDAALRGRDASRPVVLLAHQPIQAHDAARHGVDLQLSGHTHGGQMAPFNLLVGLQQPVVAGYAKIDGTQVYVTRGAGFWGPPVRFGAPPDISLIELHTSR